MLVFLLNELLDPVKAVQGSAPRPTMNPQRNFPRFSSVKRDGTIRSRDLVVSFRWGRSMEIPRCFFNRRYLHWRIAPELCLSFLYNPLVHLEDSGGLFSANGFGYISLVCDCLQNSTVVTDKKPLDVFARPQASPLAVEENEPEQAIIQKIKDSWLWNP